MNNALPPTSVRVCSVHQWTFIGTRQAAARRTFGPLLIRVVAPFISLKLSLFPLQPRDLGGQLRHLRSQRPKKIRLILYSAPVACARRSAESIQPLMCASINDVCKCDHTRGRCGDGAVHCLHSVRDMSLYANAFAV